MTGFGKSEATIEDILIQIEIRTLNSKGLDLNIRLPQILKHKELEIRKLISEQLKRGKIDAFVNIDLPDFKKAATINQEVYQAYYHQMRGLVSGGHFSEEQAMDTILRLPNVLETKDEEISDSAWLSIKALVVDACEKVKAFREKEGAIMEEECKANIEMIRGELEQIPQYEQERVEKVRERISAGLASLSDQVEVEPSRVEQELIFYIEKFDITEEKVRLDAHLNHFNDLLAEKNTLTKGKKLSFISQELGREINTIGSKANHLAIQKHVVNMKDLLERIKEQLSNIL